MRTLWWERWYPWLGAVAAGGAYVFLLCGRPLPEKSSELFSNLINLSGISVGFLATALSIILSSGKNRLIANFESIGYKKHVSGYFLAAVHSALAFCLLNAVFLVTKPAPSTRVGTAEIALWCTLAVATVLSYYRVIRILVFVFRAPNLKERKAPS